MANVAASAPVAARLRAQVWLYRWGWAWPLAGLALVGAVALLVGQWWPAHSQARAWRELAAPAAPRVASPLPVSVAPTPAPAAPADSTRALRQVLHAAEPPAAQMRRLVNIARRHGITLPRGQYTETGPAASGLVQLELSLRFEAGYPRARAFVESLLRELPNASVDRVSFERDEVQGTQADVGLRLTLWRWPSLPAAASGAGRP